MNQSLLEVLEAELPDLESEVIQEIINYRKNNRRISQKAVCDQFSVDKAHVKTIFDRMKEEAKKGMVPSDVDMNSSQSSTISEFSSVNELKQFFEAKEKDVGASVSGNANPSPSFNNMLIDDINLIDGSLPVMGENSENLDDDGTENLTDGEKLVNYVKWFVDTCSAEITSLRSDQEMFDAQTNNLNGKINDLKVDVCNKEREINELKKKLNTANAEILVLKNSVERLTLESKANLCIRCNNKKTISVAGMPFCSVNCIKQAASSLEGASNLPAGIHCIA